jgi:hypothetical protein
MAIMIVDFEALAKACLENDFVEFGAAFVQLERLRLAGCPGYLQDLVENGHPKLEQLSLSNLSDEWGQALARAHWPRLRMLNISSSQLPNSTIESMIERLPALASLELYNCRALDTRELAEYSLRLPVGHRLERLELCTNKWPKELRRRFNARFGAAC